MLPSADPQTDIATSVQSTLSICRTSRMNSWRSLAQCDIAGRANHDIDSFGTKSEVQRSINVFWRYRRAEQHSTRSAYHRSDDKTL